MSAADDAWLALKSMESEVSDEYRKRSAFHQKGGGQKGSIEDIMRGLHVKDKKSKEGKTKKKKTEKKNEGEKKKSKKKKQGGNVEPPESTTLVTIDNDSDDDEDESKDSFLEEITTQELLQKISRDLNILSDSPNAAERRGAINRVHDIVTCQGKLGSGFKKLGPADYNEIFQSISKPIFKRFADPVERCRERAFRITNFLFSHGADFVPVLGYFFPALMARAPPKIGFDEDMKLFVANFDQHDEYRRGRAVDRQDAPTVEGTTGALTHLVVEESEEVRLIASQCLLSLINRLMELDSLAVLNPYFADLVLYLQSQTRDLFPELKVVAAKALESLALLQEFESGMCFFAVALVRILLPMLRHRHAKVRVAGVDALRACMIVPNRAKRKGAGTEAMVDLVGFKEDNVLNIASFYKPNVSINYLAELTSDAVVHVRERVVAMLSTFLVDLEDRYDHQQRLLPYLLDMLTDESPTVSSVALSALVRCGELYEEQHPDDIIERRQFGIDGDDRCNLEKPLPPPFTERPRIGIRMYTRGNTKRFIFALVGELTNWQSKTRLKSANLLKMVTILCEEYLTMEMYKLLPSYIKALQYARDDGDKELESVLREVYELAGRYTAPDSYIHYILPRLRGDIEVTQFGMESSSRSCVVDVLTCFVDGSKNSLIPPYLSEIIDAIVDPYVIDPTSNILHISAINLLLMVLRKVQGKGLAVTAAHYQSTGRLKNMKETIHKAFRFAFHSLSNPDLNVRGTEALLLLSHLDSEAHILAPGVTGLILHQLPLLVHSLIESSSFDMMDSCDESNSFDDIYEVDSSETRLLDLTFLCPVYVFNTAHAVSLNLFARVIQYLAGTTTTLLQESRSSMSSNSGMQISSSASHDDALQLLTKHADFLLCFLIPFQQVQSSTCISIQSSTSKFFGNLNSSENFSSAAVSNLSPILEELEKYVPHLLKTFVFPAVWGMNSILQKKRLQILSFLLSIIMNPASDVNKNQKAISPLLKSFVDTIFRSSLSPSSPLDIRLDAANCFKDILRVFYDENRRLKSYAKQKLENSHSENVGSGIDSCLEFIMTTMLDDSSDIIRIVALESLVYLIHFVRPHYDQDIDTSPNNLKTPQSANNLPPFMPTKISFEGMVDALLLRAINGNPSEEFLSHLDFALRSLAVFKLSTFEDLVRAKLPLLVGIHKPPSAASDMFSGLLDHTEMLVQFSSA